MLNLEAVLTIQQQDFRPPQQRPRNTQPLPLASAQLTTLHAEIGIKAFRQGLDKVENAASVSICQDVPSAAMASLSYGYGEQLTKLVHTPIPDPPA
jgi:hypothetical protein